MLPSPNITLANNKSSINWGQPIGLNQRGVYTTNLDSDSGGGINSYYTAYGEDTLVINSHNNTYSRNHYYTTQSGLVDKDYYGNKYDGSFKITADVFDNINKYLNNSDKNIKSNGVPFYFNSGIILTTKTRKDGFGGFYIEEGYVLGLEQPLYGINGSPKYEPVIRYAIYKYMNGNFNIYSYEDIYVGKDDIFNDLTPYQSMIIEFNKDSSTLTLSNKDKGKSISVSGITDKFLSWGVYYGGSNHPNYKYTTTNFTNVNIYLDQDWTPPYVNITLKDGKNNSITKSIKSTDNLPNPATEIGYSINGWYDSSGKKYTQQDLLNLKNDLILYAKYTPKSYNITYKY